MPNALSKKLLAGALAVGILLNAFSLPLRPASAAGPVTPYPILFVTQLPIAPDFTTIGSTFGNHRGNLDSAGRGGDLWIRYPDGQLKNLTQAAGYGGSGFLSGNAAIAVRDPAVHWNGTKAVFSMVQGAPTQQYQVQTYYWQLYEITGLGLNDAPVITKVANQPANFNNVSPIYGTDGRIIFTSDRPRNGAAHLYPQLDEYELAPTNTGLWSLNPANGDLNLLNHAPSGNFTPIIDSFGRVVFTQWDHLQRDQQADADAEADAPNSTDCGNAEYGTFNYSSEAANATKLNTRVEVFPEPRACRTDLLAGTNLVGHNFNHFLPWQINEDGTEGEILNHLGRHELGFYIERSINNDVNVVEFYRQYGNLYNPNPLYTGLFQIKESPLTAGVYFGIDTPEFGTHASGKVISFTAPITRDADHIALTNVTHPDTYGTTVTANHTGRYREPLPLSDGALVAVHTSTQGEESGNTLTGSNYNFRLKALTLGGNGYWAAGQPLTSGITKTLSFWSPDNLITFSGTLWELNPVEVRARPIPNAPTPTLAAPEQQMFTQAGVTVNEIVTYLQANNLALVVSRNVTRRDDLDKQQPFNLRVVNGGTQTVGVAGKIYDVAFMQFFQADQLRGWTGCCSSTPRPGRRVLAQPMHEFAAVDSNPLSGGPMGAVKVASDGSLAAFVPAQRALTWQLTDAVGTGIVRERVWLTFQPGEIRTCANCHGLSTLDQAGQTTPTNPPQALLELLNYWKAGGSATLKRVYLPAVRR
jgi:hypothetical protein